MITDLNTEVAAIVQIADFHRCMPGAIHDASMGSEALEEVRTAQYNDALLSLNKAIARVNQLQLQAEELAYAERPHEAVSDLLDELHL